MRQYIVDAFTDTLFHGNQAAVCVMEEWLPDEVMLNIARENNFAETAFAVREKDGYRLRWFTPADEIDFCGHATLGTSFVLFNFYEKAAQELHFYTKVGELTVRRDGELIQMNFPAYTCKPVTVTQEICDALGVVPLEAYRDRDLLLVLENERQVRELKPNQEKLSKIHACVVAVTAKGEGGEYDCVSRCFAPELAIPEDPVTGSTHCMITPYWCDKLGKDELKCLQASARTGVLYTKRMGGRVQVSGKAVLYSVADIRTGI